MDAMPLQFLQVIGKPSVAAAVVGDGSGNETAANSAVRPSLLMS